MKWIIIIISLVVCIVGLEFCIKDRKSELEHTEYLRKLDLLDNKIKLLKLELSSPEYYILKDIEQRRRFTSLHYNLESLQKERSLLLSVYFKVVRIEDVYHN